MDSFEVNKILGAVLFTCLVLLALNITAGALFTPEPPKKPGYEIAVQEEPAGAPAAAPAAEEPIEQALASADPQRGQHRDPLLCPLRHQGQGDAEEPVETEFLEYTRVQHRGGGGR